MNCEVEFLPVGDGCRAGDAIVVRYGNDNSFSLMVVDGGTEKNGEDIVEHVRNNFGGDRVGTRHPNTLG
jgi:hypothetical protein